MNAAEELRLWALQYLPDGIAGGADVTLAPVAGDAGFRSYFRLATRPTLIAVHAPPDREDNPAFVTKGLAIRAGGVHVPAIHAVDYRRGFLLLEDLGDALYLPQLNESRVDRLYDSAESVLQRIQQLPPDETLFPAYSDDMLHREMALFPHWFVGELLGQQMDAGDRAMLDELFGLLIASAREQPAVVVHRDYHSRNLLSLPDGDVGVVDFQDAVSGPVTYDLVSLLKDCYIRWPEAKVSARAQAYLARARCRRSAGAGSTGWGCSGTSRCWAYLPGSGCGTASPVISTTCRWSFATPWR